MSTHKAVSQWKLSIVKYIKHVELVYLSIHCTYCMIIKVSNYQDHADTNHSKDCNSVALNDNKKK